MHEHAEHIEVKSVITACRDEKDNFLLSLAVDGKADFLITGDDDLLTLKKDEENKNCYHYRLSKKISKSAYPEIIQAICCSGVGLGFNNTHIG